MSFTPSVKFVSYFYSTEVSHLEKKVFSLSTLSSFLFPSFDLYAYGPCFCVEILALLLHAYEGLSHSAPSLYSSLNFTCFMKSFYSCSFVNPPSKLLQFLLFISSYLSFYYKCVGMLRFVFQTKFWVVAPFLFYLLIIYL